MKYVSENRLSDFEFHDSVFMLDKWEKIANADWLTLKVKHLNVHKNAMPNNSGTDMEIEYANITFGDFKILEFEPSRNWKKDENGKLYTDDPIVIFKGEEARKMLENELRNAVTVMGIAADGEGYELGAIGIDPYFSARFMFSSVKIEWNDYVGQAWYIR